MNLRGRFVTDGDGRFHFRSVKPAGYPIPVDGPVGELVRAAGRHNYRPAHLHFMIYKPGFKTLISQIYVPDDEHIESDVQFGVTRALIGNYIRHDEPAPDVGLRGALVFAGPAFRAAGRGLAAPQGADPVQGAGLNLGVAWIQASCSRRRAGVPGGGEACRRTYRHPHLDAPNMS